MTLIDKIRNFDSGRLKLLFGAGTSNWNSKGYVNVDIRQTGTVNTVCDLSCRLPWKDNEVDEIWAESVLEHIPMGANYVNTIRVLKEWNRVLKTGCILTLKIPDMKALCSSYLTHSGTVINYLYGGQNYPENTHVAGFSINSLQEIFAETNYEFIKTNKPDYMPWEIEIIGRKK